MKLNKWSVVKTADALGLALKPPEGGAHHYEVCVSLRHGNVEITVHVDGVFLPLTTLNIPIDNEYTRIPTKGGFKPPRSLAIAKQLKKGESK